MLESSDSFSKLYGDEDRAVLDLLEIISTNKPLRFEKLY
jgi:hypothetical protein